MEINETQLMEIMTTSITNAVKPLREEFQSLKEQINAQTQEVVKTINTPQQEEIDMDAIFLKAAKELRFIN